MSSRYVDLSASRQILLYHREGCVFLRLQLQLLMLGNLDLYIPIRRQFASYVSLPCLRNHVKLTGRILLHADFPVAIDVLLPIAAVDQARVRLQNLLLLHLNVLLYV